MSVKFLPGFIFVTMTTRQNKLSPFIRRRKYFVGLIFVIEGDQRKFFRNENFSATKIFRSTVCGINVCGFILCVFHLSKCLVSHVREQDKEKDLQLKGKLHKAFVCKKPPNPPLSTQLSQGVAKRSHDSKERVLATLTSTIGTCAYKHVLHAVYVYMKPKYGLEVVT